MFVFDSEKMLFSQNLDRIVQIIYFGIQKRLWVIYNELSMKKQDASQMI